MNKKIFTLLVGALLSIGSSFTASAQATPTVSHKIVGDGNVYFADTLRADTAKKFVEKDAYYLLSITDIANPSAMLLSHAPFNDPNLQIGEAKISSRQLSYVMFVDSAGQLRIDTLAALDNLIDNPSDPDQGYGFAYNGSRKFGALRRASWCVKYETAGVSGSNVIFDFNNMATGELLEAPLPTISPNLWTPDLDGQGRLIYTGTADTGIINLVEDDELIVSGWHFSQTYASTQNLQTGMPLYSYVEKDSVLVLVIEEPEYEVPVLTTAKAGIGGWKVTVKYVAVNDLIKDEVGNVRLSTDGGKYVSNVLLFTLKKLDKFVLNADDYNAINTAISFTPDAKNTNASYDGWNPFTQGLTDPHGKGYLRAYEVNDSLYRYGYMQFQRMSYGDPDLDGKWLYVDTAFWNNGNDEFLGFNWSTHRRDTNVHLAAPLDVAGALNWGDLFEPTRGTVKGKPDSTLYLDIPEATLKDTIEYRRDSLNYQILVHKDSIMENQSKFRVVYDPFEDRTYINVYQTRVAYPNYENPTSPVKPVWWTNSFRLKDSDTDIIILQRPSDSVSVDNATDFIVTVGAYVHGDHSDHTLTYHSFMEYYPESAPKKMDKVMISTADTSAFRVGGQPLSHIYGWTNQTNGQGQYYRDSLFYVDIQSLEKDKFHIATIDQARVGNKSGLDTHIKLGLGMGCTVDREGIAYIPNNLYLIRNAKGEYLSVPIYSLGDSVYWGPVLEGEDPTQMPSYQWVLENKRPTNGDMGSPFRLTNREFEHVSFDYVYVNKNGEEKMRIGDPKYAGAKFAHDDWAIIRAGILDTTEINVIPDDRKPLGLTEFYKANRYSTDTYSFLPLAKNVKEDQLLGYTYVDKDSTYVDVYAFKYLHFLTPGASATYMGWNGYDIPKEDSAIYLRYNDYHDKLYFMLQEMPYENIGDHHLVIGYDEEGTPYKDQNDYASIYKKYGEKKNNYQNRDSIVMENFGYMPTMRTAKGDTVYNYESVKHLKPLARQAYRLLLKDYYKFAPTIRGNYMTVGEQDRYILSDRSYAVKPYVPGSGRVEGIFGIPYFYFRDTYFKVDGVDKNGTGVKEDYFALVQRLDTVSIVEGHQSKFDDVEAYIESVWGPIPGKELSQRIKDSKELGAFIAEVGENVRDLRISVRAENVHNAATFTLEQDDDPLYRRFHWNDYFERTNVDEPLKLEFHYLYNDAIKLFENSGGDKGMTGGGYQYNVDNNGELLKDSLGNVISFLGVKNIHSWPAIYDPDNAGDYDLTVNPHGSTNYAIYVDTAYINRGTGWIKPQYMLAVDVIDNPACEVCEDPTTGIETFRGYKIGRYLYNTSMYAKKVLPSIDDKRVNYNLVQPIDPEVINTANGVTGHVYTRSYTSTKWERLAFAWAIHRGDSLYVLKNVAPYYQGKEYDTELLIAKLAQDYPAAKGNINFAELMKSQGKTKAQLGNKVGLHAIISLDDNTHKDWVFSFRYIQRRADDFIIESETTNRDRVTGPVIRPGWGGWVKYDNEVPIITRSEMDNNELLGEGAIMNVTRLDQNIEAVSNDPVTASAVKVLGGNGAITIQNASGKTVVVSNVLGQMITNTKLTSDNVSIAVPAGVVVVTIEGEDAAKVLVK